MLQTDQTVDRYVVEALIGQGGMATVYRVRHTQLGSTHALKVLSAGTRSVRDRLIQEGRVQANLRHPNLIAVTDVLDVGGDPGLVMEYVSGPSLSDWLGENELDLKEALRLYRGIVSGISHAHRKGIIHRDLKPANILLSPHDDGIVPKVSDFGLVKVMQEGSGGEGQTKSGIAMGTPEYMAPEQIRDAANVDQRADLFSLGCILYEMVCGRPAFRGPDMLSVFNAIVSADYTPPQDLVPAVPDAVAQLIKDLLVVDPERRIDDAAVILDVLDRDDILQSPLARKGAPRKEEVGAEVFSLDSGGGDLFNTPGKPTNAGVGLRASGTNRVPVMTPVFAPEREVTPGGTVLPLVVISLVTLLVVGAGALVATKLVAGPTERQPVTDPTTVETVVAPEPEPPVVVVSPEDGPEDGTEATEPVPKVPERTIFYGRVEVSGDANRVWLVAGRRKYELPRSIPTGAYDIEAQFGTGEAVVAGKLVVGRDERIDLRCASFLQKCTR